MVYFLFNEVLKHAVILGKSHTHTHTHTHTFIQRDPAGHTHKAVHKS